MQAMVLKNPRTALEWIDLADRRPGSGEIRVKVSACGVCRTDLHVVGELPDYYLPIIPGHEIVGRIDAIGTGVEGLRMDERVGVPWLGHTCGICPYCVGVGGRLTAIHRGGRACFLALPVSVAAQLT
jgi:propanol-preferring alcohol dehydrogenase